MTVYIVTSGVYSDYAIDAVFSTREMAEKYIATNNPTDYPYTYIEEYEVDSDKVITNNTIYYHYRYLPSRHDIDSIPTFTYKEPYCEDRGNSWNCTFHYWSKNGKLQGKDLMDMYTKWCMEQLEEERKENDT